ncbi:MAG: hypothetical protein JWO65_1157, partial [Sphingomonas bacterium]|nr:hypothetical protein [Sphingomonas bacterium]
MTPRSIRSRSLERLLSTAAIGTAIAVCGGSTTALAQAFLNNAYQGSVSSMTPGVTVNRNYRDDQIVVSTRAAVVNWTPDNSGTGTIDFLPTGRTVEYYGSNGNFTILNRIVPTDASRAISINGSINSTVLLT